MQPVAADAERILRALLGSRGVAVEEHGDLEAQFGHETQAGWCAPTWSTRSAAAAARSTSSAVVRQLETETRMQRLPRQVVPVKNASPVALMAAITSSVRRSWSSSVAPGRAS